MREIEYVREDSARRERVINMLMHNGLHPDIIAAHSMFYCDDTGVLTVTLRPVIKDVVLTTKNVRGGHGDKGAMSRGEYPVIEVKLHRPPWEFGVLDHPAVQEMKDAGIDAPAIQDGAL